MRNTPAMRLVTAVLVAAAASLLTMAPAGAQTGDLDCGDPGTSPNMPVGPDDPHGLDGDGDGIGCEEDTGGGAAPAPAPSDETATSGDLTELPRTGSNVTPVLAMGGGMLLCLGIAAYFGGNIIRQGRRAGA